MQATIEKQGPCHFKATLNGRTIGSFTTELEARHAIATAIRHWYPTENGAPCTFA